MSDKPKIVPLRSKVKLYSSIVHMNSPEGLDYDGCVQYHETAQGSYDFVNAYNIHTGDHPSTAKIGEVQTFWITDLIALMQAVPACGALPAYIAMK